MKTYHHTATVFAAVLAIGGIGLANGSGDDNDDEQSSFSTWSGRTDSVTAPVDNRRYAELCGSCHFAYQPGLLPALSWERIMAGLEQHYGDRAELSTPDKAAITNYLLNNAAGRVDAGVANRIMVLQGGAVPARITGGRLFRDEHDEIPPHMVADNPEIRSFANCDACHTRAAAGSFEDHQVIIPGYGRWDD